MRILNIQHSVPDPNVYEVTRFQTTPYKIASFAWTPYNLLNQQKQHQKRDRGKNRIIQKFNQGTPNFDKADWNIVMNASDALPSSALTFNCAFPDDELIIHSTRKKADDPSSFWAKKKNLKFDDWPPDAMHWIEWPCICWMRAWGAVKAAIPWGLMEHSCKVNATISDLPSQGFWNTNLLMEQKMQKDLL